MQSPWPGALWRTLLILAAAAGLGWQAGHPAPGLALGATLLCGWHLWRLSRLERWLRDGCRRRRPQPDGIWGEIYYHLQRRRQRRRDDTRRYIDTLRQFQEAARAMPDATVVLDDADTVLWSNPAAEDLLGLRSPQDLGTRITYLVRHPSFVAFLARRDAQGVCDFPSPVGGQPLSVRAIPYGEANRLLIASDVSRVHRLEQVRRDFVANVSHELRTPLTVIGGYLETLLDSGDACAVKWQQPLRSMQHQSARMLHIIEDLLMLAKLEGQHERLPPRPVAVPGMLAAIAEDAIALSGEQQHTVRVDADPALWLCGHEQELRSAFSNLVFNAIRHTPAGRHVDIRWHADARGVHLEVIDNGDGIAPHHLPRLTERFYRVDRGRNRERGGTGLGLAIVKHVMSRHGGQLRIASTVGAGSRFACDFPAELACPRTSGGRAA